jgi:hypothetical protein
MKITATPVPRGDVGLKETHRNAPARCQRLRLGLGRGREIDREDIEALLGEPYPVAALAVGDGERLAALRQETGLRLEEGIGFGAVEIVGRRVALFPVDEIGGAHFKGLNVA